MLICIPFSHFEVDTMRDLLAWMQELGCCQCHRVLLVAGKLVAPPLARLLETQAQSVFQQVELITACYEDTRPWPCNANQMFHRAHEHIDRVYKCPWWLNEPDCIPLKKTTYDFLEAEYKRCGKPFMGCIVEHPMKHLTGNAMYPSPLYAHSTKIPLADNVAWDVLDPEVVKKTHHIPVFQHLWTHNTPLNTTGKYSREATHFATVDDLKVIRPDALILHRNKDGSLIRMLREQRGLSSSQTGAPASAPTDARIAPAGDSPTPAGAVVPSVQVDFKGVPEDVAKWEVTEMGGTLTVHPQSEAPLCFYFQQTSLGWTRIAGVAVDAKKQAARERMAKARAMRGKARVTA